MLAAYPLAGRSKPAIAPEARMLVEPPYILLYRPISNGIQIVRVLHGARSISDALFSEGIG